MWEDIIIYTLWGILALCVLAIIVYFIVAPLCALGLCLEEALDDFRAWRSRHKSNPAP